MPALNKYLIKEFCGYCAWVDVIWKIKRILYDDNPHLAFLFANSNYPFLLSDLGRITQSYVLLSVVKLHDPGTDRRGNSNLTLDYMIQNGPWDKRTRTRLEKLRDKLDILADPIKNARNKILAHLDIKTIEDGKPLGRFGKIRATRYFNLLQKFVNIVSNKTGNGIYPFNNSQPITDALVFKSLIVQDTKIHHIMGWPEKYAQTQEDLRQVREKHHKVFEKKTEYETALKELFDVAKPISNPK